MLDLGEARRFFANPGDRLARGLEHEVAVIREEGLVIKDYDTRQFNDEGYPLNKPTDCLFDYLTDHLLANHLFGDDIRLRGLYEDDGCLHLVITQPFIHGHHMDWEELVSRLENQGLEHAEPGSAKARFWIDGGPAGKILLTDVHEDNVIVASSGIAYPIDVHFSFRSRQARLAALEALGIW